MNIVIPQTESSIKTVDTRTAKEQGEDWIQAIIDQDFEDLTAICFPDIKSTLLLPKRIDQFENVTDLIQRVEGWFDNYDSIEKVETRVALVGEKLAIFYRLMCYEDGMVSAIEQQIYCTVAEGRISQLRLLCSGFQPVQVMTQMPTIAGQTNPMTYTASARLPAIKADDRLEFKANAADGSTCALLTPAIKQKLGNLQSGQVLEVTVDDVTAKEDIEAWSRLSGNLLLKMDQTANQLLVFYIQKK